MTLLYRLLAHFVVLVHLAFVVFVMLGGLLAFRFRRAPWVHLPMALWGAVVEIGGWVCPLTPLENHLRRAAGLATYEGDFVGRYLLPILYPAGLTRPVQWELAALVVAVNLVIYAEVLRWRRG